MFGGLVEYGLHLSHKTFEPPRRHCFRVRYSGVKCGTSLSMRNVTLNHHQKRVIVAEAERRRVAHEPSSGQQLSLWAKKKFGLAFPPNRTTTTRLLHRPPPPPPNTASGCVDKRVRCRSGQSHVLTTPQRRGVENATADDVA